MTVLEEIEHSIKWANSDQFDPNEVSRAVLLSNLYQARAIERLEATVRAIGVHLQNSVSPSISQPTLEDIANQERNRSTPFQPPGHCFTPSAVGSGICYYCGHPAGSQEHHRRPK